MAFAETRSSYFVVFSIHMKHEENMINYETSIFHLKEMVKSNLMKLMTGKGLIN